MDVALPVYPNSCSLSLVAMGNKWEREARVEFWESVYGFKMSCMKEEVFCEAQVQNIDSYSTISSSDVVKVSSGRCLVLSGHCSAFIFTEV